jgi:uncharacterized OB-fold protein
MSSAREFVAPELVVADAEPQVGAPVTLAGSRCTACLRVEFPARATCPACGADMQVTDLSSEATVRAFTGVEYPPPGCLVDVPYVIVMADFPEGVCVLGQLIAATIDEVAIGDALTSVVVPVGERVSYGFRLRAAT